MGWEYRARDAESAYDAYEVAMEIVADLSTSPPNTGYSADAVAVMTAILNSLRAAKELSAVGAALRHYAKGD